MAASLNLTSWARRTVAAALALVSLAAVVAGGALAQMFLAGPVTVTSPAAARTSTASTTAAGTSTRVALRFDDNVATAILDDTPVARQFAAQLPLTLQLSDRMGQVKSGPLPVDSRSLDAAGTEPTFRTVVGELSYWSPSSQVAVVYDDLGQSVPDPGLVRLGVIDTGLADLAAAGDVTVRVDLDQASTS